MNRKNLVRIIRIAVTFIGAFIASLGVNGLLTPNDILAGGATGIAVVLNIFFGLDVSIMIVVINIPIFIIGYKFVSREYIVFSLIGMASFSLSMTLTKDFIIESHELLTTVLLGGIITGVGFGLIFRVNSSTGGTDILSKVLNKKYAYSIASLKFIFNAVIIGLSIFSFGIDRAVITLTTMYIAALTSQLILEGTNHKRTVIIITNFPYEVSKAINERLKRGCTIIEGVGSYTGEKRAVLYAVISINQVGKLKKIVKGFDKTALVNVVESRVVFGKGFVNMDAEQ